MAPYRSAETAFGGDGLAVSAEERKSAFWQRIRTLDAKAAAGNGRTRARHLEEAGNLFLGAELERAAAVRYGGAIDAYLEAGYFSFAHRMCLRMLEAAPQVIRVRATLALIQMGRGLRQEASALLADYVEASREAGEAAFALRRLCLMAQVLLDDELRAVIFAHVERLAADMRIDTPPCAACGERCSHMERSWNAPGDYWERLVDIGLMGPRGLEAATPMWDRVLRRRVTVSSGVHRSPEPVPG